MTKNANDVKRNSSQQAVRTNVCSRYTQTIPNSKYCNKYRDNLA